MRKLFFLAGFLLSAATASSQHVEETYPETLWCPNDTFKIRYSDYPDLSVYTASRTDKSSPGTDGYPDGYVVFYYGKDSLRINYHNKLPYAHIIYLNFASPKGKTTLRFHFNSRIAHFSKEYVERYKGTARFNIPEVYELANIIWTLSPSGQRATDLYKEGEYYQRVMNYFRPWLNHAVFKQLDFPDSLYAMKYYEFRENSFAFNFDEAPDAGNKTLLLFNGPYYYVYGDELADSSLFGKLKPLVEDFATISNFRKFYQDNKSYYEQQIRRAEKLLPVKTMWQWLEKNFPNNKYQSYRVVFSPLIGGSHSTQRYSTWYGTRFGENVMFVCGPARYDSIKGLTELEKEGLFSGVVFTEIDHNYVNPATNKYAGKVDSIFSQRGIWTRQGASSDFYGDGVSVFNEYMTHAAFCAYVADIYDAATAAFVIKKREELMVERRGFTRFREFNQELLRLYKENSDKPLVAVYPAVLEWCAGQR